MIVFFTTITHSDRVKTLDLVAHMPILKDSSSVGSSSFKMAATKLIIAENLKKSFGIFSLDERPQSPPCGEPHELREIMRMFSKLKMIIQLKSKLSRYLILLIRSRINHFPCDGLAASLPTTNVSSKTPTSYPATWTCARVLAANNESPTSKQTHTTYIVHLRARAAPHFVYLSTHNDNHQLYLSGTFEFLKSENGIGKPWVHLRKTISSQSRSRHPLYQCSIPRQSLQITWQSKIRSQPPLRPSPSLHSILRWIALIATVAPVFQIFKMNRSYINDTGNITSFKYKDYTHTTIRPNNSTSIHGRATARRLRGASEGMRDQGLYSMFGILSRMSLRRRAVARPWIDLPTRTVLEHRVALPLVKTYRCLQVIQKTASTGCVCASCPPGHRVRVPGITASADVGPLSAAHGPGRPGDLHSSSVKPRRLASYPRHPMGLQQIDFLETIIEENSDDLLTESDASWLDSETDQSVIHISTDQRIAVDKLNHASGEIPSSSSSSKSSLLQFEKLERTCYSYDSLQFNNRIRHRRETSHRKRLDRPISYLRDSLSPDSLEQDDIGGLRKFRAYHSYESLNDPNLYSSWTNQDRRSFFGEGSNYAKNCDLSGSTRPRSRRRYYKLSSVNRRPPPTRTRTRTRRSTRRRVSRKWTSCWCSATLRPPTRTPRLRSRVRATATICETSACRTWRTTRRVDASRPFTISNRPRLARATRCASTTSTQWRRRGWCWRRRRTEGEKDFDIDPSVQLRTPSTRHHHHHHHRHHHHHDRHRRRRPRHCKNHHPRHDRHDDLRQCSLNSSCKDATMQVLASALSSREFGADAVKDYNFRFADKWRSAPSLPASLLSVAAVASAESSYYCYDRAVSLPAGLDLCRAYSRDLLANDKDARDDDLVRREEKVTDKQVPTVIDSPEGEEEKEEEEEEEEEEMAQVATMNLNNGEVSLDEALLLEPGKIVGEEKLRLRRRGTKEGSSVKTQNPQHGSKAMLADLVLGRDEAEPAASTIALPSTPTVKTQDRIESKVLEIAMAMENDVDAAVDEAIRQLKREVDEATAIKSAAADRGDSSGVEALASALEEAQTLQRQRGSQRKAKKNASYELAQQSVVNERDVRRCRPADVKVFHKLNNASYELAIQQQDVMKNLSFSTKPYYRMDACEEEPGGELDAQHYSTIVYEPLAEPKPLSPTRVLGEVITRKQQRSPKKSPDSSVLGQLKKNSDSFLASGDRPVQLAADEPDFHAATSRASSSNSIDGSSLMEIKPILPLHRNHHREDATTTTTITSPQRDKRREIEEEIVGRSLIGDFYARLHSESQQQQQESRGVSKSCEDIERYSIKHLSEERGSTERETALPPLRPVACVLSTRSVPRLVLASVSSSSSSPVYAAQATAAAATTAERNAYHGAEERAKNEDVEPMRGSSSSELSANAAKRLALSGEQQQQQQQPIIKQTSSMNALNSIGGQEKQKKTGFGGFLQRFSKLRFSGRSKVPRSEIGKRSSSANNRDNSATSHNSSGGGSSVFGAGRGAAGGVGAGGAGVDVVVTSAGAGDATRRRSPNSQQQQQVQRVQRDKRKEPDYIIIPLHGPEEPDDCDDEASRVAAAREPEAEPHRRQQRAAVESSSSDDSTGRKNQLETTPNASADHRHRNEQHYVYHTVLTRDDVDEPMNSAKDRASYIAGLAGGEHVTSCIHAHTQIFGGETHVSIYPFIYSIGVRPCAREAIHPTPACIRICRSSAANSAAAAAVTYRSPKLTARCEVQIILILPSQKIFCKVQKWTTQILKCIRVCDFRPRFLRKGIQKGIMPMFPWIANGRPPVCSAKKPPLPPSSNTSQQQQQQQQQHRSNYGFSGVTTNNYSSSLSSSSAGLEHNGSRRRATTDLGNPAAIEMAKARAAMLSSSSAAGQQSSDHHHHQQQQNNNRSNAGSEQQHHLYQSHQQQHYSNPRPYGLLETDLDAPLDPSELEAAKRASRSLLNLNGTQSSSSSAGNGASFLSQDCCDDAATAAACGVGGGGGAVGCANNPTISVHGHNQHRYHHLGSPQQRYGYHQQHHHHHQGNHHRLTAASAAAQSAAASGQRPHKSMEFLLDKENIHYIQFATTAFAPCWLCDGAGGAGASSSSSSSCSSSIHHYHYVQLSPAFLPFAATAMRTWCTCVTLYIIYEYIVCTVCTAKCSGVRRRAPLGLFYTHTLIFGNVYRVYHVPNVRCLSQRFCSV
ncbi:unnamed protein product [Trichogramma brassicae]|uniref:Uncharacterized protein n=1 Tax=Trichogramma brassicae TaxID=86971 RepID=A0A6H5I2Q0_9HYME|nr:unnamed protein product [Trichogramma brassicae]